MTSIWKFAVEVTDEFTIDMPRGARLLEVQNQGGAGCLWALVDTNAPSVARAFALRGTGHKADGLSLGNYIGTLQMNGGALVFHLFDLGEVKS